MRGQRLGRKRREARHAIHGRQGRRLQAVRERGSASGGRVDWHSHPSSAARVPPTAYPMGHVLVVVRRPGGGGWCGRSLCGSDGREESERLHERVFCWEGGEASGCEQEGGPRGEGERAAHVPVHAPRWRHHQCHGLRPWRRSCSSALSLPIGAVHLLPSTTLPQSPRARVRRSWQCPLSRRGPRGRAGGQRAVRRWRGRLTLPPSAGRPAGRSSRVASLRGGAQSPLSASR
jgi:hypothetical protein